MRQRFLFGNIGARKIKLYTRRPRREGVMKLTCRIISIQKTIKLSENMLKEAKLLKYICVNVK